MLPYSQQNITGRRLIILSMLSCIHLYVLSAHAASQVLPIVSYSKLPLYYVSQKDTHPYRIPVVPKTNPDIIQIGGQSLYGITKAQYRRNVVPKCGPMSN